jgi:hypothetical protein
MGFSLVCHYPQRRIYYDGNVLHQQSVVFYPLYPLIAKALTVFPGIDNWLSLLVVANVAAVLSVLCYSDMLDGIMETRLRSHINAIVTRRSTITGQGVVVFRHSKAGQYHSMQRSSLSASIAQPDPPRGPIQAESVRGLQFLFSES